MSLIHEALQQAEAEKRSAQTAPAPAGPETFSPTPAVPPAPGPGRLLNRRRTLVALALLAGGACVGLFLSLRQFADVPHPAQARTAAKPPAAVQDTAEDGSKIPPMSQECRQTLAKTQEAVYYYYRPPTDGSRKDAKPAAVAEPGQSALGEIVLPATAPSESQPTQPKPDPVPPRLSVSGIMYTPGGGNAIVNGTLVQAGDYVGGAKVVKILPHAVELEIDGLRFQARM